LVWHGFLRLWAGGQRWVVEHRSGLL
jgi:hypothetical protein